MTTTVDLGVEVGFRLDDPVAGVLNNTIYTLGQTTYLPMTDYVYSVSVTRGKNRDLDRFNAGTCQVTLNNQARVFDPYNFASAFTGNVLPRRRVRVQTDGVTQFEGSIDDWNFDYSVTGESTASLSASDDFSLLARQQLSGVAVPQEFSGERVARVLSQSTVDWPVALRNIDTGKSVLAAETPTGNALDYLQTVTDSEQGKLFIGKDGALNFIDRTSTPTTPTSSSLTKTNLNKYSTVSANTAYFAPLTQTQFITDNGMPSGNLVRGTNDGSSAITVGMQPSTNRLDVTAGNSHYFACYGRSSFDSQARVIVYWINSGSGLVSTVYGGYVLLDANTPYQFEFEATAPVGADEASVQIVFNHLDADFTGYADFSSLIVEDASAPGYVFTGFFDGNTLATIDFYYQWSGAPDASTSEQYELTQIVDPIVFSDSGDIPFISAAVNFGTELMVNQSSVSSTAGTVSAINRSSQLEYGITSNDLSTLIATTAQLTDLANFIVARYANPEYRFESVTVNLDSLDATFRARVLAVEIGDIVQVSFTPNGLGQAIEQVSSVLGMAHSISPDRHDITFSFEVLPFTFMVLNDLVYGKLDYIGVLGF